jgi:hypothetical protein
LCDAKADGKAFDTPEELLRAVDLYELTQRTFRDVLLVRAIVPRTAELWGQCPCHSYRQEPYAPRFAAALLFIIPHASSRGKGRRRNSDRSLEVIVSCCCAGEDRIRAGCFEVCRGVHCRHQ